VAVAERIEQGVKSGRIFTPVEKRGFEGKRKEVDHFEGSYRDRNNPFQKYHAPSPSPQISNINLNTLHSPQENLILKPNTKESKNNYLHYRCL